MYEVNTLVTPQPNYYNLLAINREEFETLDEEQKQKKIKTSYNEAFPSVSYKNYTLFVELAKAKLILGTPKSREAYNKELDNFRPVLPPKNLAPAPSANDEKISQAARTAFALAAPATVKDTPSSKVHDNYYDDYYKAQASLKKAFKQSEKSLLQKPYQEYQQKAYAAYQVEHAIKLKTAESQAQAQQAKIKEEYAEKARKNATTIGIGIGMTLNILLLPIGIGLWGWGRWQHAKQQAEMKIKLAEAASQNLSLSLLSLPEWKKENKITLKKCKKNLAMPKELAELKEKYSSLKKQNEKLFHDYRVAGNSKAPPVFHMQASEYLTKNPYLATSAPINIPQIKNSRLTSDRYFGMSALH